MNVLPMDRGQRSMAVVCHRNNNQTCLMKKKQVIMRVVMVFILLFSLLDSAQARSSFTRTTHSRVTRDSLTSINNEPVLHVKDLRIDLQRRNFISQRQTTQTESQQCLELKKSFAADLNEILGLLYAASDQSASGHTCPIGKCPLNSDIDDLISKLAGQVQQIKMCNERSVICQKISFISMQMGVRETALFAKIATKMGIKNGIVGALLMESPLYQFSTILSSFLTYAKGELC